jgi:hypothetical protein
VAVDEWPRNDENPEMRHPTRRTSGHPFVARCQRRQPRRADYIFGSST